MKNVAWLPLLVGCVALLHLGVALASDTDEQKLLFLDTTRLEPRVPDWVYQVMIATFLLLVKEALCDYIWGSGQ